MLSDVSIRLRSLFERNTVESELDDELRFHFERQVEKNMGSGLGQQEAIRRARLSLGGIDQIKEECRDARGVNFVESQIQDIRYGWRMLCQKPGFTMVAVLTLALGVGASTAIFSIVNAVLLRPLPYRNPDRLVRIYFDNPGVGLHDVAFSVPELEDLQGRAGVFDEVSAVTQGSANLTGGQQPERRELVVATANYFSLLGAVPQIGRLFGPQDFEPGFAPVVVISDGYWRRSYGADPGVLGRTLLLDNDPYAIIGVLPAGFRHPGKISRDADVFLASGFAADPAPKPARGKRVVPGAIGRLKPGLSIIQAQARLTAMATEIRRDFPADYPAEAKWTVDIQSLQEYLVGNVRPMLLVLLGAVILIVLVVSLNIANLQLASASGRHQEMAVRAALGAGHGRVVRQMLTESFLLSFMGGTAGVAASFATIGFILRFIPSNIPRLNEVNIDWAVLAFALLISLFTGLLFGLAPAFQAAKSTLASSLREGSRGSGYSAKTGRLRDALMVSELALAVVLMVGAGLLLRTLGTLLEEDPGFNPSQVIAASIWLPVPNDPKADPYLGLARQNPFNRELLRRMSAIPGVELAGLTSNLPAGNPPTSNVLIIEDRPAESVADLHAEVIRVSPDYFRVIEASLVRGRYFTQNDDERKPAVAIVDEATARRYWKDREPLGRRLRLGSDPAQPWITVVGILSNIKHDGLDTDGIPHIYVSAYQNAGRDLNVVLRTRQPAAVLEPQIRREIQSIDPGLPVFHVSSMNDLLDASLASHRFSAELVSGFASVGLLLASVGIYGLLAYMVGQRTREIGLRMALGAQRGDIVRMVAMKGVILAAAGIATGVLLSVTSASMMAGLLYGVRPHDPGVFLVVPLVLFVVAVLASYLPARRATKADLMLALREA